MMTSRKQLLNVVVAVGFALAAFVTPAQADHVIIDDCIIQGSQCTGLDCVNGENFGFDTMRMKENNLRLHYDDTSNSASFPQNDWRLVGNDSSNGGLNHFSIDDATGGRTPFRIEAGARTNALYVEADGDVGIGTNNPATDLTIVTGNTPTMRLEQDGSSGFTPQTWDVAGNETNFFIRDATNGSTLPFRIKPGSPTDAISVTASGVGIGKQTATEKLDVVGSALFTDSGATVTIDDDNAGGGNDVMLSLTKTAGAAVMQFVTTFRTWSFSGGNVFAISAAGNATGTEFSMDEAGNVTVTGSVTAPGGHLPDYVFEPDYELMPLADLATFVKENKHLPNVPSLEDMRKSGGMINMNQMQNAMLEKVEELALYTLQQEETIATLLARLEALEKANDTVEQ